MSSNQLKYHNNVNSEYDKEECYDIYSQDNFSNDEDRCLMS